MTSQVEAVARAIRRRHFERTGVLGALDEELPLTENELDDAATAIKAHIEWLREPSYAMIGAGSQRYVSARKIWQAMLNQAAEGMDENSP